MASTHQAARQDAASIAKNAKHFDSNHRYARWVASMETYEQIRRVVNREIHGARRMLDIGNGGVFDYDTHLAEQIVGVDLFLDGTPSDLDPHITLRHGDALSLDEPDASYDTVLVNSVFHHLIGMDVDSTLANIEQAIAEARRVLEPGGRLVVMESCVSARAFAVERRLFAPLRLLARTPLMSHPATLQFPPETISKLLAERLVDVTVERIPTGRWILQFGFPWPTALTPAQPYLFTGRASPLPAHRPPAGASEDE